MTANIDELLDEIDDEIDKAWSLPDRKSVV